MTPAGLLFLASSVERRAEAEVPPGLKTPKPSGAELAGPEPARAKGDQPLLANLVCLLLEVDDLPTCVVLKCRQHGRSPIDTNLLLLRSRQALALGRPPRRPTAVPISELQRLR